MNAKTTKAVAPVEEKPVALVSENVPAFLQGSHAPNGSDNFDSDDVVIPRIKLLQGLSSEVETHDAAKSGEFWHTGLDISLGKEFTFIVADRRKKYLLTAPIADGQGVLARADDAKTWNTLGKWNIKIKDVKQPVTWEITNLDVEESGLTEWGTYNPNNPDSPPAATLFYDYLVFLPDHLDLGPAVISLARSQVRKAKKGLNDKISIHRNNGRPMQALVFKASSVEDSADGQDFKNWQFTSAGFVQDKELYDSIVQYAGALSNVKIAEEGSVDQDAATPTDEGDGSY